MIQSILLSSLLAAAAPAPSPETVTVTVLATTDTHGHLLPYDYFTKEKAARGLAAAARFRRPKLYSWLPTTIAS